MNIAAKVTNKSLEEKANQEGLNVYTRANRRHHPATKSILINARPGEREEPVLSAFASARKLRAIDLIEEFGSSEVASTIILMLAFVRSFNFSSSLSLSIL